MWPCPLEGKESARERGRERERGMIDENEREEREDKAFVCVVKKSVGDSTQMVCFKVLGLRSGSA